MMKCKNVNKNKSSTSHILDESASLVVRKMHENIVRAGKLSDFALPVKKYRTRIVEKGIVKSARYAHQMYPVVLDVQLDGAFSSTTYPSRVPSNKLRDVAVVLSHANYRARYGKFAIDFNSREVKFRVFRSAVDIVYAAEDSFRILRALPVQMMDQISQTMDEIIAGGKAGDSVVEKIIYGEDSVRTVNKKSSKALRVESAKKQS